MKYPKILVLALYFLCGQEYKAIAENSGSSGKEEKPVKASDLEDGLACSANTPREIILLN